MTDASEDEPPLAELTRIAHATERTIVLDADAHDQTGIGGLEPHAMPAAIGRYRVTRPSRGCRTSSATSRARWPT